MGVKTRYWGRYAWRWLHDVSMYLDIKFKATFCVDFFTTVLNCLPCPHCRRCSLEFLLNFTVPRRRSTVANRFFVYCLHEHVNLKLFQQELYDTVIQKAPLDATITFWKSYQPGFNKVKYFLLNGRRSKSAFFEFLYYVLLDMDESRVLHLFDLLQWACSIYAITMEPLPSLSQPPDLKTAFVFRMEARAKSPIIPLGHRILLCRESLVPKCS